MKKLLSISFALILIVSIFSACSNGEEKATGKNKKVLVMGTSADYKPYEYVEASKSDEIIGFDVDIAKYIGKELGYEVKVKDMDWASASSAQRVKRAENRRHAGCRTGGRAVFIVISPALPVAPASGGRAAGRGTTRNTTAWRVARAGVSSRPRRCARSASR